MDTVADALCALRHGQPVVVLDDAARENEADLILAAEHATSERIRFLVRHTSGLVCVALPGERLEDLDLPLMVPANSESFGTAFTVSVDYRPGTGSGVSTKARAATIRALVDPACRPEDLARPGHVFPLRAKAGGVLTRPGHTEAAVDLTRLAGLTPGGVLCELVNPDGTMMRGGAVRRFAAEHRLVTITVADVIAFRRRSEKLVRHLSSAPIPTAHGRFVAHAYESLVDGTEHVALVLGDVAGGSPPLVRLHRECLTGDVFGSGGCDCRLRLDEAMVRIAAEGRGVIVYLRTGVVPAIGLLADSADGSLGAQILADLGIEDPRHLDAEPAARPSSRAVAAAAAVGAR